MQTGIFYWFGFQIPNRFNLIASAGFNNVFLQWGDQFSDVEGPKELMPEHVRKAGLYVENIHTDFENTNLLWQDKLGWEDVLKRYLMNVDDCYEHQIPTMVLHLTSGKNPPEMSLLGIERIKRLVERAEQRNVNIALENVSRPEYLDYVFTSIYSDKLKFCYDSGHENCFSKNGDLLDRFGGKLVSLHLHDNNGTDDQHRIPGEGTIDWKNIAHKLKNCGFSGSISLEVTNEFSERYKNLPIEQFLAEAYSQAKNIACLCEQIDQTV